MSELQPVLLKSVHNASVTHTFQGIHYATCTLAEVRGLLHATISNPSDYNLQKTLLVYSGKKLLPAANPSELEQTLDDVGYSCGSSIMYILFKKSKEELAAAAIAIDSDDEEVVTYTGQQWLTAATKNGQLMFELIHQLVQKDDAFLNAFFMNDTKGAWERLVEATVGMPKAASIGNSKGGDFINATFAHPCGDNGYMVDLENAQFILSMLRLPHSEENVQLALESYICNYRSIGACIERLLESSVTASSSSIETTPSTSSASASTYDDDDDDDESDEASSSEG
jgi:hypothetical protein